MSLSYSRFRKLSWSVVSAAVLGLGGASAAELRLGATTSLGIGCNVAGLRVGFGQDRLGVYGQGGLCQDSAAFGAGLSFDAFLFGGGAAYAFGDFNLRGGRSTAFGLGVGARFSQASSPFEFFGEVGAQFVNTAFTQIVSPRVALGASFRLATPEFVGTALIPGTPSSGGEAGGTSAPSTCTTADRGQDEAIVRSLVTSSASQTLADAASSYGFLYSNIQYSFNVASVAIGGDTATVTGSINLSATERLSGRPVGGTFNGVVNLVRQNCAWTITGYTQS